MLGRGRGRGRGKVKGFMRSLVSLLIVAVIGTAVYVYGPTKAIDKASELIGQGADKANSINTGEVADKAIDGAGKVAQGSDRRYRQQVALELKNIKINDNPTNSPAYDRGKYFGSWRPASSSKGYGGVKLKVGDDTYAKCTSRQAVSVLEGKGVKVNANCKPIAGTWTDPYGWHGEFQTTTNNSSFEGEHIVPLKEAWMSGAKKWDQQKRYDIANDRDNLMLVAKKPNAQKGASSIDEWAPDQKSPRFCEYVENYVHVKSKYGLTMKTKEKAVADKYLSKCGDK